MTRNSTLKIFLAASLAAGLTGCTKVPPGYVAVKVNNYGSQRGVEDFPLRTGRVWYNPLTEDVYKFPTFLQTVVWTRSPTEGSANDDSITFNSVEGAVINADISISYSFEARRVPAIFVEFRKDANDITNVYVRSQVRDSFSRIASTMPVTDIFGAKKQELLATVRADLERGLGPKGFHFDMVSFVGGLRVDDRVQESINAVIQQAQRALEAENKVRQSRAEAEQAVAVAQGQAKATLALADAQAKANQEVAASLTPELVQWQAVQKWDGRMPQVTGQGSMPFVNLGQSK